jgi:DNA replication protein DnaC
VTLTLPARRKAQILADFITGDEHSPLNIDDVSKNELGPLWTEYYIWFQEKIYQHPEHNTKQLLLDFRHDVVMDDTLTHQERQLREMHDLLLNECIKDPIDYPSAQRLLPEIDELEWLWDKWLTQRMVSLLVGEPGTGKSYVALDLARRIINGARYPDGQRIQEPGDVIYVDAENVPSIFKQRVSVWSKHERERIYLMLPRENHIIINLDDQHDRDRLWDMAWTIRPSLIIIDSYGAVSLKGENAKEDVQGLLSWFTRLARDFDTSVLVIHHLRKRQSSQTSFLPMTLNSIRGSSHITAIVRNVVGLQRVPTDDNYDPNGPLRMWVMKSNAGLIPDALGVYLRPHPENEEVAKITYSDQAPQPYTEPTKTDLCQEWLTHVMQNADEPLAPSDIVEWAEDEGDWNRRMVYRVRKRLPQIQDTADNPHNPDNKWFWESDDESQL